MKSSLKKKIHDITHITTVSDAFLVPRETLGRVSQALDLETTATSTGRRRGYRRKPTNNDGIYTYII
jgi:hypothetical protein